MPVPWTTTLRVVAEGYELSIEHLEEGYSSIVDGGKISVACGFIVPEIRSRSPIVFVSVYLHFIAELLTDEVVMRRYGDYAILVLPGDGHLSAIHAIWLNYPAATNKVANGVSGWI
jgi:hypothetical protein